MLFKIWLLQLMLTFSPPEKAVAYPAFPGWEETIDQRKERYESISQAIVDVVWATNTDGSFKHAPVFEGPRSREQTAALLLAVAWHESGFARDVHLGPCYLGPYGKNGRCDGGRSACMLQVMVGVSYRTRDGKEVEARTKEGWTQKDLFDDPQKCFIAGLNRMRSSVKACSKAGVHPDHRLAAYGSGTCHRPAGQRGSARLFGLYRKFWTRFEIPVIAEGPLAAN
jgi:hypothetical protein